MDSKIKITVYLTDPDTKCWNFSSRHQERMQAALNKLILQMNSSRVVKSLSKKEPKKKVSAAEVVVASDNEGFLLNLPSTDIAIIWYFEQEWFKQAPRLKYLITPAAGRDYFQVTPPQGMEIIYGTFHGKIMAETALAAMLSMSRGVIYSYLMKKDYWPKTLISKNMRMLEGSHLTILGFGRIGESIGRLAKPFGVRITGIRRTTTRQQEWPEYFTEGDAILPLDCLEEILPITEHLVLVLPRDATTDDIMNKKRLQMLPPHAIIYNWGRGNSIDENALAELLHAGRLGGAFLDVYKEEPLPMDSPLRTAPNLFLLPHISAVAPNYLDLFIDEFLEKMKLVILN